MASLAVPEPAVAFWPGFSNTHLACLARTYDRATVPVWIYDLSARCIYENRSARGVRADAVSRLLFEIVDSRNRVVGHLATAEG